MSVRVPKYRLHKATGQALVEIRGHRIYLGKYDSPSSHERYWQKRILLSTIVGYALFYFVRKNLSVAMPVMETELGFEKTQLGMFLTMNAVNQARDSV